MGDGNGDGGAGAGNGGGGGNGGGQGGAGGGGTDTVPWSRFQEVVNERNKLRTDLEEAQRTAQKHAERAATADTLASQLEQTRKELESKTSAWDEERGLMQAGITDPDAIDVVRLFHSRLPEENRPKVGDWLASLKQDPSKAPKPLAAVAPDFFGGGEGAAGGGSGAAAGGAAGDKKGTGVGSTRTGANTNGSQRTGEPLSAEKIKQIREECQRTGDWEPWKKIRGQAYGNG